MRDGAQGREIRASITDDVETLLGDEKDSLSDNVLKVVLLF